MDISIYITQGCRAQGRGPGPRAGARVQGSPASGCRAQGRGPGPGPGAGPGHGAWGRGRGPQSASPASQAAYPRLAAAYWNWEKAHRRARHSQSQYTPAPPFPSGKGGRECAADAGARRAGGPPAPRAGGPPPRAGAGAGGPKGPRGGVGPPRRGEPAQSAGARKARRAGRARRGGPRDLEQTPWLRGEGRGPGSEGGDLRASGWGTAKRLADR